MKHYIIVYHVNMLNFKKTFRSVRNLKMKFKPSLSLLNPPSKHTLNVSAVFSALHTFSLFQQTRLHIPHTTSTLLFTPVTLSARTSFFAINRSLLFFFFFFPLLSLQFMSFLFFICLFSFEFLFNLGFLFLSTYILKPG